jgi:hypothetical protein
MGADVGLADRDFGAERAPTPANDYEVLSCEGVLDQLSREA